MINKKIGYFGENLASQYLKAKAYTIIGRNIKIGHLELDIIAFKNGYLYLFEIKTRLKNGVIKNEQFISGPQNKNLKKAALRYAALNNIKLEYIKFDLIVILLDPEKNVATIKHFSNIF